MEPIQNANQNRLDFIRQRRCMPSTESVLRSHIQEKADEVRSVVESQLSEIGRRFDLTREVVRELRETAENYPFLETPNTQTENLAHTLDSLKETLSGLESTLSSRQREMEELNQKKKQLQTSLSYFTRQLKNTPVESPYSDHVREISSQVNQYMALN